MTDYRGTLFSKDQWTIEKARDWLSGGYFSDSDVAVLKDYYYLYVWTPVLHSGLRYKKLARWPGVILVNNHKSTST